MNVQERRERKAKKHADYLARLKAQDEKNRGVAPSKEKEPEAEKPVLQEDKEELKFSTQPVEAPEPLAQVEEEEVLPEIEGSSTDDSKGPVEEPEPVPYGGPKVPDAERRVQEEVSSEELEAPVLEGKKKKGGRKKK